MMAFIIFVVILIPVSIILFIWWLNDFSFLTRAGKMRELKRREKEEQRKREARIKKEREFDEPMRLLEEENSKINSYLNDLQNIDKRLNSHPSVITNPPLPLEPTYEKYEEQRVNQYFQNNSEGAAVKSGFKKEDLLAEAIKRDTKEYQRKLKIYKEQKAFYDTYHPIDVGIKQKDIKVFPDLIKLFKPFQDVLPFELPVSLGFEKINDIVSCEAHITVPIEIKICPDYEYSTRWENNSKYYYNGMGMEYDKHEFSELEKRQFEISFFKKAAFRVSRELSTYMPIDVYYITFYKEIVSWISDEKEKIPVFTVEIDNSKILKIPNLADIDDENVRGQKKLDEALWMIYKAMFSLVFIYDLDETSGEFRAIIPKGISF